MTGTFCTKTEVEKTRTTKITDEGEKGQPTHYKKTEFVSADKLTFLSLITSKNKHARPSHKAPNVF